MKKSKDFTRHFSPRGPGRLGRKKNSYFTVETNDSATCAAVNPSIRLMLYTSLTSRYRFEMRIFYLVCVTLISSDPNRSTRPIRSRKCDCFDTWQAPTWGSLRRIRTEHRCLVRTRRRLTWGEFTHNSSRVFTEKCACVRKGVRLDLPSLPHRWKESSPRICDEICHMLEKHWEIHQNGESQTEIKEFKAGAIDAGLKDGVSPRGLKK